MREQRLRPGDAVGRRRNARADGGHFHWGDFADRVLEEAVLAGCVVLVGLVLADQ